MSKTLRCLLSVFIAVALVLTAMPFTAMAEENVLPVDNTAVETVLPDGDADEGANTEEAYIIGELIEKRESNVKHFRMSDGTITAAYYTQPVHYEDENGSFVDIDNTLSSTTDDGENAFGNRANSFSVKFMKKSNKNKLYTITKGNEKIKVAIEGVSKVDVKISEPESTFDTDSPYKLENIGSKAVYTDIFENADLEYTVVSDSIKENLILKSAVDFTSIIYNYKIGNKLKAVTVDEKTVDIINRESGKLIFRINAPTMWDSAGNFSDDLTLEIIEESNTTVKLKLSWDNEFLKTAVYPVTVDPVNSFSTNRNEIQDTHIHAADPNHNYNVNDHVRIANRCYTLIKFPTPVLNSGDKIIKAQLSLVPYGPYNNENPNLYTNVNSYNPALYITAHKILKTWDEKTVTYNSADHENGFYDDTVYSYRIVDGDNSVYTWDITRLANEWLEGDAANHGIFLKYDAPPADGTTFDAFFCSTNGKWFNTADFWPQILYQYINTTGIEDYYSYHTQSVGAAGTVYTNDMTGNVTVVNNLVSTGGSLMPLTATLVYNSNNAGEHNNATKIVAPYSAGWNLNWAQKIDRTIETELGYYCAKYIDADGTAHYFNYESSSGLFIDETDKKRKIVWISGTQYNLVDETGISYQFIKKDASVKKWYLTKITDPYGNYIDIELNASNPNRVDRVTSSTGNKLEFVYNSNILLEEIKYYKEGNITKTVYVGYNTPIPANGAYCADRITYADGTVVRYYYTYVGNTPYLSKAVDIDGYNMKYEYIGSTPARVKSIKEYSSNPTLGQHININYQGTATVFSDVVNNRKYLYTFSTLGTLTSVVDITSNDGNGYGQYYEYNEGNTNIIEGKGNLTFMSKTQKSTVNKLRNHSFENNIVVPSVQAWSQTTGTTTGAFTTEKSYIGNRSYKLTRSADSNSTRSLGYVWSNVEAGKKYTISAYVNTAQMTSHGKGACILLGTGSETLAETEFVTERKDEWQRISATFTAPYSSNVTISVCMVDATGSVYFDNIQFEEGGLSDYNMLENAGFEFDDAANISGYGGWSSYGSDLYFLNEQKISGNRGAKFEGGINVSQEYYQRLSIPNGKANDAYVVSAFAKAASVPSEGWRYSLLVRFIKGSTDVNDCNYIFNSNTTEWQKVSGAAVAKGDYDTVIVWLLYYSNCNTVYFDNVQLIKDTFGNTYFYDENNNLTSTVDLQGKAEYTFQYDGYNQLKSETTVSGSKIEYNYNSTIRQRLDSVESGGVTTAYTYDSRGNMTASETYATDDTSKKITSSAVYSTNGEYTYKTIDSRGVPTSYTYEELRGMLKTSTAPNGTVTSYTYNDSEQVTKVAAGKEANNADVDYTYDAYKRLSSITSPSGTVYNFTYDEFSRSDTIKIGNTVLSDYAYDDKGNLATMLYGNNAKVDYIYDCLNRKTGVEFDDIPAYSFDYDGKSRLSEVLDIARDQKQMFVYDILDRLTGERLINALTNTQIAELKIRYDDSKNRVSGYDVDIEGVTKKIDYIYDGITDAPDIINGVKQNDTTILSYSYDGLNRQTSRTIATTTPYVTDYTYLQGATESKTTTLLETLKNGNDTLKYTYDNMGNITSISKNNVMIESYTYDYLNQLKTVTNSDGTYTYEYDNGGNIISVLLNGAEIKDYTYSTGEWKDLLTAFNGDTITYDSIGNPIEYLNGMNFTWSQGRKLTGITKGTDSIAYTYNADGLRTSKTVNGTTTEYYWLNGILQGQKTGSEYILFLHDENGTAYGFLIKNGEAVTYYYYLFNAQGDVIGILDNSGTKVVEYTYDVWGKLLSVTGTLANTIGQTNPIRYRGYYYDSETSFYYLQSRYYDAEIGRFLNADGQLNTNALLGYNMFAYCYNNPVMLCDCSGNCPHNGIAPEIYNDNCFLCNPESKLFDIVSGSFEAGIKGSLELVTYAFKNSVRPNNIGKGIYLKQLEKNLSKLKTANAVVDDIFTVASYAGVVIETSTNILDNRNNGKSWQKIAWDATVDTAILGANTYVSIGAGATIGSAIPVPIVGTLVGAVAGFGIGVFLDNLSYLPRQEIKSLVR